MADADIYSLVNGDEPSAQESAQAMAAALRKQKGDAQGLQSLGLLTSLGSNPVLSKFGPAALHAAGQNQEAATTGQHQLGELLLGKLSEKLREQQASAEQAYREGELGIRRQQLQQDNWVPTQLKDGSLVEVSKKSGQMRPLTSATGGGGLGGGLSPKEIEAKWKDFREAIGTAKSRGRLTGGLQERLNAAERLEALVLGPGGQLQNLTPQQLREAATATASLIGGGGGAALGQIEELVPHTLASQFANVKQKLLNEPQGADAQAFLQNMLDTAGREKKTTLKQMRGLQLQSVPDFMGLQKMDKARFERDLKGAGLDPAELDESGLPRQAPGSATPTDSSGYLFNKLNGGKTRILKGPDGRPAPGAQEEPNPDYNKPKPEVASRG